MSIPSPSRSYPNAHPFVFILLLASLLRHARPVSALGECYFPGSPPAYAADYYPCDKYAVTSVCCMTGWTCFDNDLCIATDPGIVNASAGIPLGTVMRGTCTNPAWNDTACGDFCLNDPVLQNNGSVEACPGKSGTFCCGPATQDGSCDCGTGSGTFSLPAGNAVTIIGVEGLLYTSTATSGTSAAASSSTAAHSPTSASASTTSQPSTTSTTTSSSSYSSATPATSSPHGPSTAIKATAAVASVVAAALLVTAILFLIRHIQKRRRERRFQTGADSDSDIFPAGASEMTVRPHTHSPVPVPHPYIGDGGWGGGRGPRPLRRDEGVGTDGISAVDNPYSRDGRAGVYEGT